jgi:hypothetical protein
VWISFIADYCNGGIENACVKIVARVTPVAGARGNGRIGWVATGCGSFSMYETRHQRILPRPHFVRRVAWTVALSTGIAAVALIIGVLGFHYIANASWIDAVHNASMILGGMGPVVEMKTDAAKLFSSAYALLCGLVFVGLVALMLAPVMHRVLHRFHADEADLKKS